MKWAIEGQRGQQSALTQTLTKVSRDYDDQAEAAKAFWALVDMRPGVPTWCLSEAHPAWRK
jgi:hypothetical protein